MVLICCLLQLFVHYLRIYTNIVCIGCRKHLALKSAFTRNFNEILTFTTFKNITF